VELAIIRFSSHRTKREQREVAIEFLDCTSELRDSNFSGEGMMRIILAVLILFGSVIASNAACILGMGSDCPLSDSEAEAKIRSAIDGKTLENQTVHLLKIIQNRIDMPGVWQVVSYQYQLGSETRQGYVGFGKCSDGWCIQSICYNRLC